MVKTALKVHVFSFHPFVSLDWEALHNQHWYFCTVFFCLCGNVLFSWLSFILFFNPVQAFIEASHIISPLIYRCYINLYQIPHLELYHIQALRRKKKTDMVCEAREIWYKRTYYLVQYIYDIKYFIKSYIL